MCGARGTLIVPHWPPAAHWPILRPFDGQIDTYVIGVIELPLISDLFLPGHSGAVLFNGSVPNTKAAFTRQRYQVKTKTFVSVLVVRLHQNDENA